MLPTLMLNDAILSKIKLHNLCKGLHPTKRYIKMNQVFGMLSAHCTDNFRRKFVKNRPIAPSSICKHSECLLLFVSRTNVHLTASQEIMSQGASVLKFQKWFVVSFNYVRDSFKLYNSSCQRLTSNRKSSGFFLTRQYTVIGKNEADQTAKTREFHFCSR